MSKSVNLGKEHAGIRPSRELPDTYRWIGKCKKCGAIHRVEGAVGTARGSFVVVDERGNLYDVADLGTNPSRIPVRCGDHWARLERVTEGTKKSKHECGARCTNATGPGCDCRCRGANHGSGR